jgi:hypothetical protein
MNRHILLDNQSVAVALLTAGARRFFSESLESPSYVEHMGGMTLEWPRVVAKGPCEVTARTRTGVFDPAFYVVRWRSTHVPTIIYHHGSGEDPFDVGTLSTSTFKNIFLLGDGFEEVNLIAVRAPFHRIPAREYMHHMAHLANFTAMFATSVTLIEGLVRYLKDKGSERIIVSGISLGGWITNLHRTYCNTADIYVPLLAGAALGEIFFTSIYRRMAAGTIEDHADAIRQVLNFEDDFEKVMDDNVSPLLGRYDRIIVYERQKVCYGDTPVRVLEKGHITAAMASAELRRHIIEVLRASPYQGDS